MKLPIKFTLLVQGLMASTIICLTLANCTQSNKDTTPPKTTPEAISEKDTERPLVGPQVFEIEIGKNGFVPSTIDAVTQSAVKLVFKRTAETECGESIFVPEMHTQKAVPLNGQETIIFVPELPMKVEFFCGSKEEKGFINGFVNVKANPKAVKKI